MAILISQFALAQKSKSPVSWSYTVKKISRTEAIVTINGHIEEGWHIYSQFTKDGGPLKTTVTFESAKSYELIGNTIEEGTRSHYDNSFKLDVIYFKNLATFKQKIKLNSDIPQIIKCKLDFSPCTDKTCLMIEQVELNVKID